MKTVTVHTLVASLIVALSAACLAADNLDRTVLPILSRSRRQSPRSRPASTRSGTNSSRTPLSPEPAANRSSGRWQEHRRGADSQDAALRLLRRR